MTIRWYIAIFVASAVMGCSYLPETKDIATFSSAAETTSSLISASYSTHIAVSQDLGEEAAIQDYIGDKGNRGAFDFPPKPERTLNKNLWGTRLAAIKAIGTYAKALSDFTDPALREKAGSSLQKLVASGASLASALGKPEAASQISGLSDLAGSAARALLLASTANEVRHTIREADPIISTVGGLLKEDLEAISTIIISDGVDSWPLFKKQTLQAIRRDPAVPADRLYEAYVAAASQNRSVQASVVVIAQGPLAIGKLVAAHKALANSSDDDQSIATFAALAEALAAYVAKAGGSKNS